MDFDAIPLYNKIILEPATPKEIRNVTNNHVLQKQKNVLGRSEAVPLKMYATCQHKKGLLKNKRIRNDRIRLLHMYVPFTKDTSHFAIVWNRKRWSVFELSAIAVNTKKKIWRSPE